MDGFWLSLGVFVVVLYSLVSLHRGLQRFGRLADVPDTLGADPPKVSVIFSALNEETTIERALRSLLALDYPRFEVIATDDRSTDSTGAIMDRLAAEFPDRLRVTHIRELPAGWLGKNHALQRSAEAATGDFLLFTDADVIFQPSALRRAASYCELHRLDHFVVLAEFTAHGSLLQSMLLTFYSFAFATHHPWKVRDTPSAYIGMGAFNMVRADAYRRAGGHEPLKLEVVDDIMLGRQMKARGFTQDCLLGVGAVEVEWYRNTGDMMRGLEKNSYAMVQYSVPRLVLMAVAVLLARYWPFVGLFVTSGAAWWLNVGSIVMTLVIYLEVIRTTRWPLRCLWWWPVTAALMMGIVCRGVALTLVRGGINWRGTLYRLEDLRKAREAFAEELDAAAAR